MLLPEKYSKRTKDQTRRPAYYAQYQSNNTPKDTQYPKKQFQQPQITEEGKPRLRRPYEASSLLLFRPKNPKVFLTHLSTFLIPKSLTAFLSLTLL